MEPNFNWVVYLDPNLESIMCPNKDFSNFSNLFPQKIELTSHFFMNLFKSFWSGDKGILIGIQQHQTPN